MLRRFLGVRHCSKHLTDINCSFFTKTLESRYFYYYHFVDGEMEVQRG